MYLTQVLLTKFDVFEHDVQKSGLSVQVRHNELHGLQTPEADLLLEREAR